MKNPQERWTPEQYKAHQAQRAAGEDQGTRNKYGNEPVIVDGILFQSKKEAKYYGQCKMRKIAGNILKFEMQKTYDLVVNGVLICQYRADFILWNFDGTKTVIDVKSKATEELPVFKIKKALMLAIHGIEIIIR